MKKFLLLAMFAIAFSAPVFAQETVKITIAFQNLNVANQNLPGGDLSVDYRLANFGKWRLGAVGDVAYQRDTDRILDRYQLLGGPQISYAIGEGRLTIFGQGLFGVTRFDQRVGVTPDFTRMTVGVGGGFDVRFNNGFFVRPLRVTAQYIDGRGARYTTAQAGGGFEF